MAQEYEEKIVKIIQEGNIQEFKRCWITRKDIDRPLTFFQNYKVVNQSNSLPFPYIKNPTLIVFSILCEQPDILLYLCQTKSPDLTQKVNGWAPIHYAACTKDYRCLRVLLKFQIIQENIDIPVTEPIKSIDGRATTALHIAVTNRRHAQVILLTQNLPQVEYNGIFEKIAPDDDVLCYQSANVLQMSTFGSLPIHIAARLNDMDMCRILMYINDDIDVLNDKNQTPLDIAEQYQKDKVLNELSSVNYIDIDGFIRKYIPELIKEEEEKYDLDQIQLIKTESDDDDKYNEMRDEIDRLKQKVASLQRELDKSKKEEPQKEDETLQVRDKYICCKCGTSTNHLCPICNMAYCQICLAKHMSEH